MHGQIVKWSNGALPNGGQSFPERFIAMILCRPRVTDQIQSLKTCRGLYGKAVALGLCADVTRLSCQPNISLIDRGMDGCCSGLDVRSTPTQARRTALPSLTTFAFVGRLPKESRDEPISRSTPKCTPRQYADRRSPSSFVANGTQDRESQTEENDYRSE
jgi:hypothetical protein